MYNVLILYKTGHVTVVLLQQYNILLDTPESIKNIYPSSKNLAKKSNVTCDMFYFN